MMPFTNVFKRLLGLLIAGVCLKGVTGLQLARLDQMKAQASSPIANQNHLESASVNTLKRLPAFGFSNVLADWTYLRFVQYFGDEAARKLVGYSLVPEYFEAIVHHDPHFVAAYLTLSPASSIYAGSPRHTVKLLAQALQSMTINHAPAGAYYLWLYKGIDEMLFLGDMPSASHSYATAAQWAKAENTPESQVIIAEAEKTAAFLAANPDGRRARIGAWTNLLGTSSDIRVKRRAIQEIEKLGGRITVFEENGQIKMRIAMPKTD